MTYNSRLYNLDHCTYRCQYHLVWITKYRGKVLGTTYIKQELKRIFKSIAKWKGLSIMSWHIGDEHIHILSTIAKLCDQESWLTHLRGLQTNQEIFDYIKETNTLLSDLL